MAHDSDPVADPLGAGAPARRMLELLGDRWTGMVLFALSGEPRRFGALNKAVPGISNRMLSRVLRGFERDGIVTREVFASVPPMTEYALTEYGTMLREPIAALCAWAVEHEHLIPRNEAAQADVPGAVEE